MRPSTLLFQADVVPISLPVCDHYAGSEKLMRKSMALQKETSTSQHGSPQSRFDITFDCEDGATLGQEKAQAQLIAELIDSEENHFNRVGVRIHEPSSSYFEQDIKIISASRKLAYVVIPKIRSTAEIQSAIKALYLQREFSGLPAIPVHVLIETHGALAEVKQIAALTQIECLSFGIMDFISGHYGAIPPEAMRSPLQFTHPLVARAKLEIAAACHLHGKVASHNVTTEFKDTAVVFQDAKRAFNEFGYQRMWSIHPDQIQPIIKAFSPRDTELHEAITILSAAKKASWGPIQMNGRLHDRASYHYYWLALMRAKASGLTLPEHATELLATELLK